MLRWVLLILVPILAIPVLFFVFSVVGALRTHGNYSFKAKWADWLRAHHAEIVTKELEDIYFKANAAKKGGNLKGLNAIPTVQSTVPHAGPTTTLVPHLTRPSSVPLVVEPGTAGEGQWQPTGPVVGGQPGMYIAQFRADDIYTSQLASAVWIDPKLLRVRLVPGYQEPGGDWVQPHYITGPALPKIAAAFNGGFRFQDAHGGFYLDGRMAIPLVDGAASMVIYKDGRINIGAWGRDVAHDARRAGRAAEPHAHGRQRRARPPHQPQRHQLLGLHARRQHRGGAVGHRRHQGRRARLRRRAHAHRQEPGREPAAGRARCGP